MAKIVRYTKYKTFSSGEVEVITKNNVIYNNNIDRSRKEFQSFRSAASARSRSHRNLLDILRCNEWSYFLTFTFGGKLRYDDDYTRLCFSEWQREVRDKFPSMYYVAVPEYHKKGALHFHLVVGGISKEELQLSDSGRVLFNSYSVPRDYYYNVLGLALSTENGNGMTVYNVNCWSIGFSTATEVRSTFAVSCYISKYISKADLDPRFYNKKRFFTSHNVLRPVITSHADVLDSRTSSIGLGSLERDGLVPVYECPRFGLRKYIVSSDVPRS